MAAMSSGSLPILRRVRTASLVLALPMLALGLAACDSSSDPLAPDDNGHADSERVEILTRGPASALLAVWIDGEGWQDADGNAITELPNPIDREGQDGLQPLRVNGPNASLTVRFFGRDGEAFEMGTVSRDPVTRSRECTEYSARYRPTDTETSIFAWPNIQHPDETNGGPFQFARLATGGLVGIFHCDHVHFYPEQAGSVQVQFRLWHVDHSDLDTDPITVVVEEGDPRFELQTRGDASEVLGYWTEGRGWRDADGNAIERIEAPRDVEGQGLQPLTAFGPNASLTLRYFDAAGRQVDFGTAERQADGPRDRRCTPLSARFRPVDTETTVTPWPTQPHPDGQFGDPLFAELSGGDLVAIFHCDHIHIYPEAEGTVELIMQAWDGEAGAPLDESAPIEFVVTGGE